jgi:hypothetical protein
MCTFAQTQNLLKQLNRETCMTIRFIKNTNDTTTPLLIFPEKISCQILNKAGTQSNNNLYIRSSFNNLAT